MTNIKLLAPTYYARYTNVINQLKKTDSYLNIGCGDGFYERKAEKFYRMGVGVDLNFHALKIARKFRSKRTCYIVADASNLPFKSKSFDTIVSIDVVEHIKYPEKLLGEIDRLLKTGGGAIICTPNNDFPLFYDPINYVLKPFHKHIPIGMWGFGHVRIFKEKEFRKMLENKNLKLIKVNYTTHHLAGLCENYLSDIGRFFMREKDTVIIKKSGNVIEKMLLRVMSFIANFDEQLFKNSKTSVNMIFYVKK